ncbi:unnamed protein product, partial [Meganyctiphanes norvegica]
APNIEGNIVPSINLSGTTVTVAWTVPTATEPNDTVCATRARVDLQVGSTWMNSSVQIVAIGEENTQVLTLDPCQHGSLTAKVIYLTIDEKYETQTVLSIKDKKYAGSGAKGLTIESFSQSCSLHLEWGVTCSPVEYYTVTWVETGSSEAPHKNETSEKETTIHSLKSTTYIVTVQAFWSSSEEMGETIQDSAKVKAV